MPRADDLDSKLFDEAWPARGVAPGPAFDVVVMAASLGGLEALRRVLAPLPANFPAPILVAQHVDARSPSYLPALLKQSVGLAIKHAAVGERLQAGTVYVAPPGRHLLVRPPGECELCDGPRINFARPSADQLFSSAADAFGRRALGVVLTGRLSDGTAGAASIRRVGGVVLAQDPATCRAAGMPRSAIDRGVIDVVLPLPALADALIGLVTVPGVPALFGVGQLPIARSAAA